MAEAVEEKKKAENTATVLAEAGIDTEGEIEASLKRAIEVYSIPDSAFSHPKGEVLDFSKRLLESYQMTPAFFEVPERCLFALAIGDTWLGTGEISEKKALINILKLVAVGRTAEGRYGILSHRVETLSRAGKRRGTVFNPDRPNNYSEFIDKITQHMEVNTHHGRTAAARESLTNWGPESPLHTVRQRLGIATPEQEMKVDVVILNSYMQMVRSLGLGACFLSFEEGTRVMIFGDLLSFLRSFEHEYAHSQGYGLTTGYGVILFEGLNEALTEGSTSNPRSYPAERFFLDQLLVKLPPDCLAEMYKAYRGDGKARIKVFSQIVNACGIKNLLLVARMNSNSSTERYGKEGQNIVIDPHQAVMNLYGYPIKFNSANKPLS